MKLGILTRDEPVYSLRIYRDHLAGEFAPLGVDTVSITGNGRSFREVDVVWDPGLISARFPHQDFQRCPRPVVVTIHGLAGHTLSIREYFPDPFEAVIGQAFHQEVAKEWKWFREKVSRVIAVSKYGAEEVASVYKVSKEKIAVIYHGIAHDIFKAQGSRKTFKKPYMLQIAQFAPKKNVDRVLEAYIELPEESRPELVVILPNYEGADPDLKGVKIIREGQTQKDLARWYRGALGFIFPSIHETFGLPVLEAMACGCPVITSSVTAIPELVGDAALLVNPRSVEEITHAIRRLLEDETLRRELGEKGIKQAGQFTWEKSARKHLETFQSVLPHKGRG